MRIAEIFRSLQGEGFLTGTPSVFVRASGCNLRCWFCDTPYTSWEPEGEDLSVEEILRQVDELLGHPHPDPLPKGEGDYKCGHVVLTGGEPMLFAELVPLAAALRQRGLHITVETAGTLYLPLECDLMSISPKLAGSAPPASQEPRWNVRHEESRHLPDVIRRLVTEYPYQIKFVVDSPDDCLAAEAWLEEFPQVKRSRVLLMPQGINVETLMHTATWLEPYCRRQQLNFCPRKHIEWFGNVRGT
ncbi:MAG TPA: 7-carboxy-7-deazaguanine synthase QueE [Pirellulales bacterium]|nr:7-carboxy-7-deazaguanine synthase QueE [Pirellulales bacterium]